MRIEGIIKGESGTHVAELNQTQFSQLGDRVVRRLGLQEQLAQRQRLASEQGTHGCVVCHDRKEGNCANKDSMGLALPDQTRQQQQASEVAQDDQRHSASD